MQLSSLEFLDYFFKIKIMYRKNRFKNRVLLSGQCAYGCRLLITIYGSFLEDNVNKS